MWICGSNTEPYPHYGLALHIPPNQRLSDYNVFADAIAMFLWKVHEGPGPSIPVVRRRKSAGCFDCGLSDSLPLTVWVYIGHIPVTYNFFLVLHCDLQVSISKMFPKQTLVTLLGGLSLAAAQTSSEQYPSQSEIEAAQATTLPYSPVSNVEGLAFNRFVNIWLENTVSILLCKQLNSQELTKF